MYFNDGSDPWNVEENHIRVFNFDGSSGTTVVPTLIVYVMAAVFIM